MTVHIKTVVPIAVLFFSVVSAPLYAHAEEAVITPGGIVAATNAARAQHERENQHEDERQALELRACPRRAL
jgi:hypothetical protein